MQLPDYEFYRGDVAGDVRKHGAGLYVDKKITRVQIEVNIPNLVVVSATELDVYFVSVYRPPSYSSEENVRIIDFLHEFVVGKEVIILGDFNLPSLKWPLEISASIYASPVDRDFRNCFVECGLTQWVEFATFVPSGNTLDLILTSDDDRVVGISSSPPFPGCHHCPVILSMVFQYGVPDVLNSEERLDWRRANYPGMIGELLELDWYYLFQGSNPRICYRLFLDTMEEVINKWVPRRRTVKLGKWLVVPPRALLQRRAVLWNRYKQFRRDSGRNSPETVIALEIFNGVNYEYRNYAKIRQCNYERKLAGLLSLAPKAFHSYLRERKAGCPSVGPLQQVNGNLVSDCSDMSNMFAEAFSSVYVVGDPVDPHPHQESDFEMEELSVTYTSVLKVLQSLDGSSAAGPDGIHPMLLKECAEVLALPLALIFQGSLDESVLPVEWKISQVSPIFKSGSKGNPLNYRPVSLTSACCKVFERLIVAHVTEFLENHQLLSKKQFGFRRGHSAEDQLLLTYGDIIGKMDKGRVVEVIYLDFAKAFDVVNFSVMFSKLRSIGLCGKVLSWIEGFLLGRHMFVSVGGQRSTVREVQSGVPQGSVLGPLLFLVYVNFLVGDSTCNYYAYADDFKLYISYPKSEADGQPSAVLQAELDNLSTKARSWNLSLNAAKCVVMKFGSGIGSGVGAGSGYQLGDAELKLVSSHKDLGVIVDSSLKFHTHISTVVRKASGLGNQLLRGTVCRTGDFMITIFVSHIRPILDYASSVWSMGYLGDVRKLESVQRRWTRQVSGLLGTSYRDRLEQLGLFSIYGRSLRADLIKLWKVFNSEVDVGLIDLFERNFHSTTRGHSCKISIPICRGELRRRFWSVRCVNVWNGLPEEVVEASSLGGFKRLLDVHMGVQFYDTVDGQ